MVISLMELLDGQNFKISGEGSISVSSNQLTLNNSTTSDPPVACYQQTTVKKLENIIMQYQVNFW